MLDFDFIEFIEERNNLLYQFGWDRHGRGRAIFSLDNKERYFLSREFKKEGRNISFLMLNPSTADAGKLDPTVTRCMEYGKNWGFDRVCIVNIYPIIGSDPMILIKKKGDRELNRLFIEYSLKFSEKIICAWGSHREVNFEKENLSDILFNNNKKLYSLGYNYDGNPKHPLYLKSNLEPIKYKILG